MTSDREEIIDTCIKYGWHADFREWDRLGALFTDRIHFDNRSMPGGGETTLDRADLIGGWVKLFATIGPTQHIMTNHLVEVDGDTASCIAQFHAQHLAQVTSGDGTLLLAGHYRFGLVRTAEGWRINSLTLRQTWSSGNMAVLGGARGVAEGQG